MTTKLLLISQKIALAAAIAVVACAFRPTAAEIGALGSGTGPGYVFADITDSSDPIGQFWKSVTAPGTSFAPLNTSGFENGDGRPSILYNPASGLTMVAWASHKAAGYDVVLSVFQNGAWSDPQTLAGGPADELDPFLFLGPDNSVHIVYWVNGTPRQVMHRQAPPDLSSWSDPERVSQPNEEACRPAGVFYNGVLRVAYEVHNFGFGNTPREVVLARREETGFVPEIVAITNYAGEVQPQPHVHAGKFWLDWMDADNEAAWVRLDSNGRWEPTRYEPFNGALEREFLVRRAIQLKAIQ